MKIETNKTNNSTQSNQSQDKEKVYYEHKPVREFKAKISKDGKYWLLKDITTHFVPRNYLSKIEAEFGKEQTSSDDAKSSGKS